MNETKGKEIDPRDIEPEYGSDDWARRSGYELASAHHPGAWDDMIALADDIAEQLIELRQRLHPAHPQPDWSSAPEWAQWWAVDSTCLAAWFDHEPATFVVDTAAFWARTR